MGFGIPADRPAAFKGTWFGPDPPEGYARLLLNVVPDARGIRTRAGGVLFADPRTDNPVDSSGGTMTRCLGVTDFRGPTGQFYTVAVFMKGTGTRCYAFVYTGIQQVYPGISSDPPWTVGDAAGLDGTFDIAISSDYPVSFAKFGKDLFMAGPFSENRVYRMRFEVDGSIFVTEAYAVDRTAPAYQRGGDDPGPYLTRAPQGRVVASNGTRLFVLGDALYWSNLGDGDAWPGNNVLPLGGALNDAPVGMAYLWGAMHVFKSGSAWRVAGDFATVERTRADVVATGVGLVSPRGIITAGGTCLLLTATGLRSYNGNDLGPSVSVGVDSLLRSEGWFDEFGDNAGTFRPSRIGLNNAWAAFNPRTNTAVMAFDGDRPLENRIGVWHHFDTGGQTIHTHPAWQAGAWIPSSDGIGNFVVGDNLGRLFVQGYGPNDVQTNSSSGVVEAVAIDTRFVPHVFRAKTFSPLRLRFGRVRAEEQSNIAITLRVRPVAGSAPSTSWTDPTFTTLREGSDGFDVLAGATGTGFRLNTDRLETDTVVDVRRGTSGWPSSEWYFEVASNALNAEWHLFSYGADVIGAPRR